MSIVFTEIFSKKGAPSTLRKESKKRMEQLNDPTIPDSRKFEHKMWFMFNNFTEKIIHLNHSSDVKHVSWNYKLPDGNHIKGDKRLDGFFVSEDVVFICEATIQKDVFSKVKDFFELKNKLLSGGIESLHIDDPVRINFKDKKIVWLFVSKHDIDKKHKEKFENEFDIPFDEAGINVIYDDDIEYMDRVIAQYNKEAANDFTDLAFTNFIRNVIGIKVKASKNISVPAIRYSYNDHGHICYSIVARPCDLIDFCSVIHRRNKRDLDQSYQRFVTPKRLKEITSFIDSNNQFANNIIMCSETLKSDDKNFKTLATQKVDNSWGNNVPEVGLLELPNYYGDMHIIDGQHRLFSYHKSINKQKHLVNILLFDNNLESKGQMTLFKDINEFQKKLTPNHIWELYEYTLSEKELKQNISSFFNACLNNEKKNFLLFHKVKLGSKLTKDSKRGFGTVSLSLNNICQEMISYKRIADDKVLYTYLLDIAGDKNRMIMLINTFLYSLKSNIEWDWEANGEGLVLNGNAFRGLLRIFREILYHWESEGSLDKKLNLLKVKDYNKVKPEDLDLENDFSKILKPIFEVVKKNEIIGDKKLSKKMKTELKTQYAQRGGSGPSDFASEFAKLINANNPFVKPFGKGTLINQSEIDFWRDYGMQVLMKKGETNDVEVKSRIFINELNGKKLDKEKDKKIIKNIAVQNLKGVAAMNNLLGGMIIVGLEDKTWDDLGCNSELDEYGGFDKWKQNIIDVIQNTSNKTIKRGDINIIIEEDNDGKKYIQIKVSRKKIDDIEKGNFTYWKNKRNEDEVYIRSGDKSKPYGKLHLDQVKKDSEIRRIKNMRKDREFLSTSEFKKLAKQLKMTYFELTHLEHKLPDW